MDSMDVLEELAQLIDRGALTEQSLAAMTQITPARLHAALTGEHPGSSMLVGADLQVLTNEENARISVLAGMLAEGVELGDDERLKSIIESLTAEVCLTVDNIARLIDVDAQELTNILHDPAGVPAEVKYSVGIRSSYLINAINRAHG